MDLLKGFWFGGRELAFLAAFAIVWAFFGVWPMVGTVALVGLIATWKHKK
jgi:hypothetical protein